MSPGGYRASPYAGGAGRIEQHPLLNVTFNLPPVQRPEEAGYTTTMDFNEAKQIAVILLQGAIGAVVFYVLTYTFFLL